MTRYELHVKRLIDLVLAAAALVLLSPLLAIAAVLIAIDDGFPVLFKQERVGKDGCTFTIVKFRSLPRATRALPSDQAADVQPTRVGRWLRRTNIDELPQLINVLRGEMSVVGPRPPLSEQYDVVEGRRSCGALRLRPGLTGLAQVNSFDGMTAEEKVRWDCSYAQQVKFSSDASVVVATLRYLAKPPPTY